MKIKLNDMIFYGYHGVYEEERKLGQRFIVNLIIETNPDYDQNVRTLDATVDYTKIYDEVCEIVENYQFHVLEDMANTILDNIFEKFEKVCCATISIQKPAVPIKATLKSVEIELMRNRK